MQGVKSGGPKLPIAGSTATTTVKSAESTSATSAPTPSSSFKDAGGSAPVQLDAGAGRVHQPLPPGSGLGWDPEYGAKPVAWNDDFRYRIKMRAADARMEIAHEGPVHLPYVKSGVPERAVKLAIAMAREHGIDSEWVELYSSRTPVGSESSVPLMVKDKHTLKTLLVVVELESLYQVVEMKSLDGVLHKNLVFRDSNDVPRPETKIFERILL